MYRQHQHQPAGAGVEQQYAISASGPSFNFPAFPSSINGAIDHPYQSSPQHLSPPLDRHFAHARQTSNDWHGQHRQPSSSLSPQISNATPVPSAPPGFTPTDRALPAKNVTADTITDAYVAFVLYCNPKFDLDVDTTTLSLNFQTPPKSDNKDFEIYRLFELIEKFDTKEIKTWGQLALDLGVEAPDVSKGQSVQKVQQYSVRLKRWMRAMHVDAFFEYLLGKQHAYFNEIPHPSDPYPTSGRDGVVADEDLAIRALDPAFRPKRGRRRNSETEQGEAIEIGSASKRPRLVEQSSQVQPHSAHPATIGQFDLGAGGPPDPWAVASAVTPQSFAPWARTSEAPQSALDHQAPSHLRWQLHGGPQSAVSPHPMSALPGSMAMHVDAAFENEPRSAIVPSTRKRRKHGPAVSSAWPSGNTPGSKPRGRPPASRNVQDGPFSTFPADPSNNRSDDVVSAVPSRTIETRFSGAETPAPKMPPPVSRQSESSARPGRLSLQVPPHTGGPVRLATPPRVLVNGENNDSDRSTSRTPIAEGTSQQSMVQSRRQTLLQSNQRDVTGFAYEDLRRVLAGDLLRGDLLGRRQRLNGEEVKGLADAVLERLGVPRADTRETGDDIVLVNAASWLGVGEQLNVPLAASSRQPKRIMATRFRVDAEGYEEIVSAYDERSDYTREVFDLKWEVSMGGCNGVFEMKGLSLGDPAQRPLDVHDFLIDTWAETAKILGHDEFEVQRVKRRSGNPQDIQYPDRDALDDNVDWKTRYAALEFGTKMARGEYFRFRERVIGKVLDALLEE